MAADPALRQRLGAAGRARVQERFTWDAVARQVEALYAGTGATGEARPTDIRSAAPRARSRPRPITPESIAGRTLEVAPHPDDEALGCGGTMAALAAGGYETGVVFLTDGGLAGAGGRELAAASRSDEARAAGGAVDLYEYPIWLWDRWPWTPPPRPWPPTRQRVKQAIRRWRASLSALARREVARLDTTIDIAAHLPTKRMAIDCYESQLPGLTRIGRGRFMQHFDEDHEYFRKVSIDAGSDGMAL